MTTASRTLFHLTRTTTNRTLLILVLALLFCADPLIRVVADPPLIIDSDPIPRNWVVDDISKSVPPIGHAGQGFVLAWIIRRGNGIRIEQCLVLKALQGESVNGKWVLAVMCRSTGYEVWRVSEVLPTPQFEPPFKVEPPIQHFKTFKTCPNNTQIYTFLDETSATLGWKYRIDGPDEIVGVCVCESTWKSVIGEAPSRFFRVHSEPRGSATKR